jgi:hypothetical protein
MSCLSSSSHMQRPSSQEVSAKLHCYTAYILAGPVSQPVGPKPNSHDFCMYGSLKRMIGGRPNKLMRLLPLKNNIRASCLESLPHLVPSAATNHHQQPLMVSISQVGPSLCRAWLTGAGHLLYYNCMYTSVAISLANTFNQPCFTSIDNYPYISLDPSSLYKSLVQRQVDHGIQALGI